MFYFEDIWIASDHAGLDMKEYLKDKGGSFNKAFHDVGTHTSDSVDYPAFGHQVCQQLQKKTQDMGVLICGTGFGMSMVAGRYDHIRAAVCWCRDVALLARSHNNANVLCLGARFTPPELAHEMLDLFLRTPFEGGRHQRRLNAI